MAARAARVGRSAQLVHRAMIATWWAATKLHLLAWWGTAAAVLAGLAALYLYGRWGGAKAQATTDKAKDAQANAQAAQQVTQAATVRQGVENETAQLPTAPPQTVATADPATAAGKLRVDGWLRDDPGKN